MILAEDLVIFEEDDPLEEVPELTHVPRPSVTLEDGLDLGIDVEEGLPELLVVEREEVAGEVEDVVPAFAQGRSSTETTFKR
jgi:hypothetical protein